MLWVHIVWGTRRRQPLIKRYFRGELNSFIKNYGTKWGIGIDTVNGMPDHIHVLLKLPTTMNVSEAVKLLKGASSKWINENFYPSNKFAWQQGYGAFAVSRYDLRKIRRYIYHQEKHHKNQTYKEEIEFLTDEDKFTKG